MRKLLTVVAVMLGCLVPTGAALADPAMHEVPPDDVFVDVNPCTGQLTTITNSFKSFVIREGTDAAGGFHVTGTGVGTITTADGFSGRFTFWFGFNATKSGTTVETFTNSNTLGNGSGQRVLVTVAFHVTVVNGEVRVEHEHVNFTCVGKPA
jgi:hypothetical protein